MDYRVLLVYTNMWRIFPFYLICKHSKFQDKVNKDINVWIFKHHDIKSHSQVFDFGYLVMNVKEFRNVMLNRLHRNKFGYIISRLLFKPMESLYINMPPEKIGGVIFSAWIFDSISC